MRIVFLCSTPYQLFNAVIMKGNHFPEHTVDLCVFNYFKGSADLVNRLEESGLFNEVVECRFKDKHLQLVAKEKLSRLCHKLRYHFGHRFEIEKQLPNKKYDSVFFSNQDPINEIIVKILFRRNPSIEINHFEDGWVDYIFPYKYFYGKQTKRMNCFWKTPKEYFTRENSYFYRPDIAVASIDNPNVKQIKSVSKGADMYINQVFGYTKDAVITANVIYFDTLQENKLGISMQEHMKVLGYCSFLLEKENIVVKKHPRNFSDKYEEKGYIVYANQSVPFEVICANQNFERKLLISSFSTACFSPKILFDQEPFVILTYKLTGNEAELDEETKKYLKQIKNNYRQSNRIIIPESVEQLKNGIKKYVRYINNEKDY